MTIRVGLDPCDVISHRPYLPPLKALRWDQHREVGFSASTGESACYVSFFAARVFDSEDEHMLRHPAFVARDVRSDPQSKTFLAEQRIAAISGAVGPDLTR